MRLIIINQNDTFIADSLCYLGISYKPTPADITSALGSPPAKSHYLRLVAGGCSFDYGPLWLEGALKLKGAIEEWLIFNDEAEFSIQQFMERLVDFEQQPIKITKFKAKPVDTALGLPGYLPGHLPGQLRTKPKVKRRGKRVVKDKSLMDRSPVNKAAVDWMPVYKALADKKLCVVVDNSSQTTKGEGLPK